MFSIIKTVYADKIILLDQISVLYRIYVRENIAGVLNTSDFIRVPVVLSLVNTNSDLLMISVPTPAGISTPVHAVVLDHGSTAFRTFVLKYGIKTDLLKQNSSIWTLDSSCNRSVVILCYNSTVVTRPTIFNCWIQGSNHSY
jgi:hypothetical protein